jgi:adenosine deaminase
MNERLRNEPDAVFLPKFLCSSAIEDELKRRNVSFIIIGQRYEELADAERKEIDEPQHIRLESKRVFQEITRLIRQYAITRYAVIVEAHCSFEAIAGFAKAFQSAIVPEQASGCFLLVSEKFHSATPPLDSANGESEQSLLDNLRHNQFYIRMLQAYGWATFSHVSRLDSLMKRIFQKPDDYLRLSRSSVHEWRNDIARIDRELRKRLELGVWANTLTPRKKKWRPTKKRAARFFPGVMQNSLKSMALAHQFGRLNSPKAESIMTNSGIDWFIRDPYRLKYNGEFSPPHFRNRNQASTIDSRNLWEEASKVDRIRSHKLHWELVQNAGTRNRHRANAFVFDLLCDLSQMLSKGTSIWASDSIKSNGDDEGKPIRVLAVKDRIRGEAEQSFVEEMFHSAFTAAFRKGTVAVDCINYALKEDGSQQNQAWDEHEWWLDRIEGREFVEVRNHAGSGEIRNERLLDYDIILIEAEFSNRFVGPSIIHWLDHMLDEVETSTSQSAATNHRTRPQIFMLSRDENAGHSFMCLWLGAQAYASKSRIFGIPSLFTMANIRNRSRNPDKKRLRPNFYALEGLLPHQRNRLQSYEPSDLIIGDNWDRYWVKQLPKADLHYHIGTSITLDAIRALAANTAGYLLEGIPLDELKLQIDSPLKLEKNTEDRAQATIALELIENACRIAVLYTIERQEFASTREIDPYKHLYGSARYILRPTDKHGKIVSVDAPDFNALDSVVHWLVRNDRPVRTHEACAAMVTAISVLECLQKGQFLEQKFASSVYSNWAMLDCASDCLDGSSKDSIANSTAVVTHYLLDRIAMNWQDLYSGRRIREIGTIIREKDRSLKAKEFVSELTVAAVQRCVRVFDVFTHMFHSLMGGAKSNWLFESECEFAKTGSLPMFNQIRPLVERQIRNPRDLLTTIEGKNLISLDSFVKLPDGNSSGASRSLKRYLIGCDLLGAEHLQYPENILLGACDIVRQNVEDNVVYSELRCATTGYSRGGMNVIDATDLLCKGFDIGAILFGSREPQRRIPAGLPSLQFLKRDRENVVTDVKDRLSDYLHIPRRWVRANILLGAKRHKAGDLGEVVPLVVHYVERGPEVYSVRKSPQRSVKSNDPGTWWRSCQVAGFDLSGNESVTFFDLSEGIAPLFASCAPITIHAGEAMSAKNIWEAVYKLNAQRIGHGLRLRDDKRLLEHCVRNGICMELCPVSNDFTNVFRPMDRFKSGMAVNNEGTESQKRDRYPMLDFLDAGLEVCLNTDNRSLHNASTLTDEYLKAADLCGGLTKWDVLRICKSGFKNAFLSKEDLASLLRHVEYEIYKIVSEHSGENNFPNVERYCQGRNEE